MDAKDIKKLTEKYTVDQLESCIQQQISKSGNSCEIVDETDEVIVTLSKAEVVREMMDRGLTFSEALRELGHRIRAIYGK